MNWYYSDGGKQVGPINETKLNRLVTLGAIRSDTLVWHDGLTSWQPLGVVPGRRPSYRAGFYTLARKVPQQQHIFGLAEPIADRNIPSCSHLFYDLGIKRLAGTDQLSQPHWKGLQVLEDEQAPNGR